MRRLLQLLACFSLTSAVIAEEQKWIPLFDGKSLGNWQETDFAGRGEVSIKDETIVMSAGGDLTGINLKQAPARQNYELELMAQKIQGSDFFCGLTFPVGEKCATFIVGGWGGALTGISSINGADASENMTTSFKKYEDGQWYRIRVRVTDKKLEAWVDEELMADVELEGLKIDVRSGEIELSQPLGIASFRTKTALKEIRWRVIK